MVSTVTERVGEEETNNNGPLYVRFGIINCVLVLPHARLAGRTLIFGFRKGSNTRQLFDLVFDEVSTNRERVRTHSDCNCNPGNAFLGQEQWYCGTRLHTRIFTEEHGQTNSVPPATDCYAGNYVLQS